MIIITASALMIIICIVALELLNNGRHRKFNYIGMGLTTAGAVNIASTLLILRKGYLNTYSFCSFEAYDSAIKHCFSMLFNIFLILGVIIFAVGFIMLLNNYRYYNERRKMHMAKQLTDDDKLTDYMDDYYTKNMRTHVPGEEFEKDIKKIEFDD